MQFSSVDLRPVTRSMEIACQHSPSLSRWPGDSRCDIHVNCRYSKNVSKIHPSEASSVMLNTSQYVISSPVNKRNPSSGNGGV